MLLITWTSKTYEDIAKKQRRHVLLALHTRGEDHENLAKSRVDRLRHNNLALSVFEHLKPGGL